MQEYIEIITNIQQTSILILLIFMVIVWSEFNNLIKLKPRSSNIVSLVSAWAVYLSVITTLIVIWV